MVGSFPLWLSLGLWLWVGRGLPLVLLGDGLFFGGWDALLTDSPRARLRGFFLRASSISVSRSVELAGCLGLAFGYLPCVVVLTRALSTSFSLAGEAGFPVRVGVLLPGNMLV